ncbi:hypothetical protein Btru_029460 [Bulinus truncatus]|nr:hypothetical protein Btru_029460 [Bulinus truncatus]
MYGSVFTHLYVRQCINNHFLISIKENLPKIHCVLVNALTNRRNLALCHTWSSRPASVMSEDRQRPGSADTMCLVLKPRQEDYKSVTAQLASSESERVAYRKNRIIQMSLNVILAEICLQEKSSCVIFRNEEKRFLQEVSRRQAPPPSVRMLQEMRKKFSLSGDKEIPPIKNKPSFNSTLETSKDRDASRANTATNKSSTFTDGANKLPSAFGARERHVVQADVSYLTDKFTKTENYGNNLGLPIIKTNYLPDLCDPIVNDSDCNDRKSFPENEVNKDETEIAEKSGNFLPSIIDDINNNTENVSKLYVNVTEQENTNMREINVPQITVDTEATVTFYKQSPPDKIEIRADTPNENFGVAMDADKRDVDGHATEHSTVTRSVLRNKKRSARQHSRPDHVSGGKLNIISRGRLGAWPAQALSRESPKV